MDANNNLYGWNHEKWFENVYGGNQPRYARLMDEKYTPLAKRIAMAKEASLGHTAVKRTVDFVFKNQSITHKNIGILCEGFPVWRRDPQWHITSVPDELRYAILVDNASLPSDRHFLLTERLVQKNDSDYMDKIKRAPADDKIAVLTRSDLRILIFAQAADKPALLSEQIRPTPYKISLQKDGQEITLYGLEIASYAEIPRDTISGIFFFAVLEAFK